MSKAILISQEARKFAECEYNVPQPDKTEPTNVDTSTSLRFIAECVHQLYAQSANPQILLAYNNLMQIEHSTTRIAYVIPARAGENLTPEHLKTDLAILKALAEPTFTLLGNFLTKGVINDDPTIQTHLKELGECLKRICRDFKHHLGKELEGISLEK
jgi:hypothetical protein